VTAAWPKYTPFFTGGPAAAPPPGKLQAPPGVQKDLQELAEQPFWTLVSNMWNRKPLLNKDNSTSATSTSPASSDAGSVTDGAPSGVTGAPAK